MGLDRLEELVSARVGVIRDLSPQSRGAEEPMPPHLYTATLSHFDFRSTERTERIAAGKGTSEEEAKASAIGEAIERYCASHWDPLRISIARCDDLTSPRITPAECVLYSDEQYRQPGWQYRRWEPSIPISWMEGVELPERKPVLVPAGLSYLVHPTPREEDNLAVVTSNGLAAGATLASAVLSALCEVMERDALMITWLNRLPAVEVDLEQIRGWPGRIYRHYKQFSVNLRTFCLPSDLPAPVMMTVAFDDRPGRPAAVVGMGCHPDPNVAVLKSVYELCQARPAETRRFIDRPPAGRLQRYEDVRSLDDHSAFVTLPERRSEFEFLWARGARIRLETLPNPSAGDAGSDLIFCTTALSKLGLRVAYVDLTTPDITDYGIFAVRVLVTDLQPIHFGHGQERLGGRRLYELPHRLGFAPAARTVRDLNPCPHPMA
jgi:ribosomal protein S12 methylthiotransferase accessory factor